MIDRCSLRLAVHSVFVVIAVLSSGCTSHYFASTTATALSAVSLMPHHKVQRQSMWTVHGATPIFLSHPADFAEEPRRRAMLELHHTLSLALKQTFPSLSVSASRSNLLTSLELAREAGSELLIWPRLVEVNDRLNTYREVNEGSALHPQRALGLDKVLFQVLIYEVRTHRLIDVANVRSQSRFLASNTSVPLDLFEQAVNHYVLEISASPML